MNTIGYFCVGVVAVLLIDPTGVAQIVLDIHDYLGIGTTVYVGAE